MKKQLTLTNVAPVGFKGIIKFTHKGTPFGEINIKEPLQANISLYVFMFKIMEDLYKDQPELQMHRFTELFERSFEINGKEKTEKQIMDMFGEHFKITFSKK